MRTPRVSYNSIEVHDESGQRPASAGDSHGALNGLRRGRDSYSTDAHQTEKLRRIAVGIRSSVGATIRRWRVDAAPATPSNLGDQTESHATRFIDALLIPPFNQKAVEVR